MKSHKFFKYFLLCISIAASLYLAFLYYQYRSSSSKRDAVQSPSKRFPGPRVQIKGFQFSSTHEGNKIITIQADKFTIEKKKLGLLSFGLINIVRLTNADIDIFGNVTQNDKKDPLNSSVHITFENIFQENALPSFSVKRFSTIEIEPVVIKLHDQNGLIIQVTASSATISLRNQDAVFSKNVRIIAGNKVLESDRVTFNPVTATFTVDRHFVLNTSGKKLTGEKLRTDIYLNITQ